jgi:protein TonB
MVATKEAPPTSNFGVAGMEGLGGSATGVTDSLFGGSNKPKVQAAAPKKVNISAGVAVGMLLQKTTPVYPPIAKAARVSGTVVLQATISKTGLIENLRVISGPAMLQQAALDAVKTWRYRPYLLNNEPVEVETTVNVIFTLGG